MHVLLALELFGRPQLARVSQYQQHLMNCLLAILLLLAATYNAASARNPLNELKMRRSDGTIHDPLERAGPSGSVVDPPGGQTYRNYNNAHRV